MSSHCIVSSLHSFYNLHPLSLHCIFFFASCSLSSSFPVRFILLVLFLHHVLVHFIIFSLCLSSYLCSFRFLLSLFTAFFISSSSLCSVNPLFILSPLHCLYRHPLFHSITHRDTSVSSLYFMYLLCSVTHDHWGRSRQEGFPGTLAKA